MDDRIKIQEVLIGKTYHVSNSRKGNFVLRITAINEPWITGVIVAGRANAMVSYNVAEEGESITIRSDFSRFQEIQL